MRNRVVLVAVLLGIGASGTPRGPETIADPSAGKDALPPKEVRASSNTIAAILTVYPRFVVETSEGPVQGVQGGPGRVGCKVRAAGPAWGQLGWKEALRHAADGPGVTSFALRKERVLCIVSVECPPGSMTVR